jgi:ribonuclease HI
MDIFTDSSYDQAHGIAGIGLYILNGVKQRAISNWIPAENNNYGEIFAIYQACILMNGHKGTIHTDSQIALAYINNEVKDKPRTREQYIRHNQMRLMAYKVRRALPEGVEIVKTKAHTRQMRREAMSNQLADNLAKFGVCKFYDR